MYSDFNINCQKPISLLNRSLLNKTSTTNYEPSHKEASNINEFHYFPKKKINSRLNTIVNSLFTSSNCKRVFKNVSAIRTNRSFVFGYSDPIKIRTLDIADEYKRTKNLYIQLKSNNNSNSVKVCGGNAMKVGGKSFEAESNIAENKKVYSVSKETIKEGWADKCHIKTTTNYESSKFNTINHSFNDGDSITSMYKKNKVIFHRLKGITEFSELGRKYGERYNKEFNNKIRASPKCFYKKGGIFTIHCDLAKSFGPSYKL